MQSIGVNGSDSFVGTAPPTYAPDDDDGQDLGDWDFYMMVYGCSLLAIIVFGALKSVITMKVGSILLF